MSVLIGILYKSVKSKPEISNKLLMSIKQTGVINKYSEKGPTYCKVLEGLLKMTKFALKTTKLQDKEIKDLVISEVYPKYNENALILAESIKIVSLSCETGDQDVCKLLLKYCYSNSKEIVRVAVAKNIVRHICKSVEAVEGCILLLHDEHPDIR